MPSLPKNAGDIMVFATVGEVRAVVHTSTLKDEDILGIINEISKEILVRAGTTDESNPLLISAGKNAIYAAVLRRMKFTGELAARVKHGSGEQQNDINQEIRYYEDNSNRYLRKYLYSANTRLYGRVGIGSVNHKI